MSLTNAPDFWCDDAIKLVDKILYDYNKQNGKSTQFELPGKFMKVSYNDSLSDKSM